VEVGAGLEQVSADLRAKKQFSSSASSALRSPVVASQPLKFVMTCHTSRVLLLDGENSMLLLWSALAF